MPIVPNIQSPAVGNKESVARTGPHDDVSAYCLYMLEERQDGPVKITADDVAVAHSVQQMLESRELSERLAAMQDVLAKRDDCGLAHLVLAREGCANAEAAETAYRRALEQLLKEFNDDSRECSNTGGPVVRPWLMETAGYAYIAEQFACYLWQRGKRDEALEVAGTCISVFGDAGVSPAARQVYQTDLSAKIDTVRYRTFCWLIEQDADEKAGELLSSCALSEDRWYLLQALLLFRSQGGDTAVSRAALQIAGVESITNGGHLTLRAAARVSDDLAEQVEGLDADPEAMQFLDDMRGAWEHTEHARNWLVTVVARMYKGAPAATAGGAGTESTTDSKLRQWQKSFDLARTFVRRGEKKDALKNLRLAMREAEKLGDEGATQLDMTVEELLALLDEKHAAPEEIAALLEKRLTSLRLAYPGELRSRGLLLRDLALRFKRLGQIERAIEILAETLVLFEQLLKDCDSLVCLSDVADGAYQTGFYLQQVGRYNEAEPYFQRALELRAQYLGPDHPENIGVLEHLLRCLHFTDKPQEEAAISARLKVICPGVPYDDTFFERADVAGANRT